ncbi:MULTISPECIES: DUF6194 family protein [unclassified Microbacterium]|uniref:DUF6194 family protein n=1 Tax=unclassified Microbacterium TaxID=2609290 RepID=UPI0034351809
MDMQTIIRHIRGLDGSLVIVPEPGGTFPPLAVGDAFFYHAPDGRMPERTQPYATIITKDYPDDTSSSLDLSGRFRVNIHVGRDRVHDLADPASDPSDGDVIVRHPLYGDAGWVSVVAPGARTSSTVLALLSEAHDAARARSERRSR